MIQNEEDPKLKEGLETEMKRILNIQNNEGNTILHEAILNEKQTMTARIRRLGLVDEYLENKKGQTAKHIENDLKEEDFKEKIAKQKLDFDRKEERNRLK